MKKIVYLLIFLSAIPIVVFNQNTANDQSCGRSCIENICEYYQINPNQGLLKQAGYNPVSMKYLVATINSFGITAAPVKIDLNEMDN